MLCSAITKTMYGFLSTRTGSLHDSVLRASPVPLNCHHLHMLYVSCGGRMYQSRPGQEAAFSGFKSFRPFCYFGRPEVIEDVSKMQVYSYILYPIVCPAAFVHLDIAKQRKTAQKETKTRQRWSSSSGVAVASLPPTSTSLVTDIAAQARGPPRMNPWLSGQILMGPGTVSNTKPDHCEAGHFSSSLIDRLLCLGVTVSFLYFPFPSPAARIPVLCNVI